MIPSNKVIIDTRCYSDYAGHEERQEYVWTEAQEARQKSGWKPNESQDIFVRLIAPDYSDDECKLVLCEFSDQNKEDGVLEMASVPMHADQLVALAKALMFVADRMKTTE